MVPASFYLIVSAAMFTLGAIGVILRRNVLVLLMCIELMLNAVNLSFVTFSRVTGNLNGQAAVFFTMVVAAAEAAVGLSIIIAFFKTAKSVDSSDACEMRH